MIDVLLNNQRSMFDAINSATKYHHEAEVKTLKSKIRQLESSVEFLEQKLIFEQRKNEAAEEGGNL